jgi:Calx-beta domain
MKKDTLTHDHIIGGTLGVINRWRHSRWLRTVFAVCGLALAPTLHAGNPANPILFVTQVPIPEEVNTRDITQSFMSITSPFGNHQADTLHAGRGGSLFVRFNNGQIVDLLAAADWSAIAGGKPASDAMAVRNPAVNWTATKAIFSMTVGKPSGPADTTQYLFQLYEITLLTQAQLAANVKPVLTKVANQPAYNNVFPTYAQGGKIVFASDRPYNGQAHLTQREEYLSLPTVSGLWALDPADATSLKILHHAPSGAFYPFVDSAGRLLFTNWDHLSRDTQAVTDSRLADATFNETFTHTTNGSGNFADESAAAAFTQVTAMTANTWDTFPEPRNFDRKTLANFYPGVNGNAFNLFTPWMINLDGTGGELLNHVGRHEVGTGSGFTRNFNTDANLSDFNPATAPSATNGNYGIHNFFTSFFAPREDPLNPGVFYGADGPDLGTHGAGRISKLTNAATGVNPDAMLVTYITDKAGAPLVQGGMNIPIPNPQFVFPSAVDLDLYRTPVPLADGNLIASHVAVKQTDYNTGTVANPVPVAGYNFRLRSLKPPIAPALFYTNDVTLTAGIAMNTSYWVGATLVSYNGLAWELDPTEVVARAEPAASSAPAVHPVTAAQFTASNVHLPTFQKYLIANNAALSVSFDVTKRDRHDKQQPYNLRVSWSGHQTIKPGTLTTIGSPGVPYDIAWMRFHQGDLRRGYALTGSTPLAGRRVVATPMHDTMPLNVPTAGAPAGSVRIGDDGSVAAIVPAGKAMTWEMLNNDAALTSQVKERFWVTFQRGEVRTCANCHGINTFDQAGATAPSNPPSALAALLAHWKTTNASGTLQFAIALQYVSKTAGSATLSVTRTGGSTGPVSVNYATADGTALAGADYTTKTGTLNWLDGDGAAQTITVPLLNNPIVAPSKTLTVTLSAPSFGTLGTLTTHTLIVTEPPPAIPNIDVDDDKHYYAPTDGLLIARYLLGITTSSLVTGAIATTAPPNNALRTQPIAIVQFLDSMRPLLDVDGDGRVDPQTDGMIVLRYLFGLRGSALTNGLISVGPWPPLQIETYIQSLMP